MQAVYPHLDQFSSFINLNSGCLVPTHVSTAPRIQFALGLQYSTNLRLIDPRTIDSPAKLGFLASCAPAGPSLGADRDRNCKLLDTRSVNLYPSCRRASPTLSFIHGLP
jgi:hypothetical protein